MPDTGAWCPCHRAGIEGYLEAVRRVAPDQVAAVYGVGALALGDFSARQSNIDLVVVAEPRLEASEIARLAHAARGLRRGGRDAEVWYVSWEDLDRRPAPAPTAARRPAIRPGHAHDPGHTAPRPDGPVRSGLAGGGLRPRRLRAGPAARLRGVVAAAHGLLVLGAPWRPWCLEAARLAQAAITGRVLSKSRRVRPCHRVDPPAAAPHRRGGLPARRPDVDVLGSVRA